VTIDATSAPTHVSGGPPVVALDFNRHPGLLFAAGSAGSQLLGVAVDDANGNGVTLDAGQVTLNDNYIGLNLAGAAAPNRGNGVYVSAASARNFIGRSGSRASGVVANVISGNRRSGIVLAGSSWNTVVANRIGTNAAGTWPIANRGDGIRITGRSRGNEIGGTAFTDTVTGKANNPTGSKGTVTPVFVVPPLGNLISGNRGNGVMIDAGSMGNVLNGNFIGTTASGDSVLGNAGNGVWIDRAPGNSLVGCKFVNNPFVYYNVVSGNHENGLRVTSSDNVTVQGNFFGAGANNTAIVKNRLDGILVDGTSVNIQVGGVIPLGNVSAGNGRNGIEVTGKSRGFVTFNTFGGLLAFKGAAPNGNDGLLITSTGGNNLARTNVFSGNRRNGIELARNASGVTVDPDIVGLNTKGNGVLPNGGDGLLIDGTAHNNTVGGTLRSVIPQNTFSGNRGYGVVIRDGHITTASSAASSERRSSASRRWAIRRAAS
jgi:parallel beta-helix repeat protein